MMLLNILLKKLKTIKTKTYETKRCLSGSYDYMDSFGRFSEKKLPTKDDFYSILNDERISYTQYVHAIKVWNTFKLNNIGEYHDLYLKSDVLLLTDVFENFRKTCMQYYKLDHVIILQFLDYLGMQC